MTAPRHFARLNADGTLAGLIEHGKAPERPPDGMVPLSPEQHALWRLNMDTRRWVDGELLMHNPGPVRLASVPKALVIDRLAAAGKLRAFRAALGYGKDDGALSDAELAARERFDAASVVASDDAGLREALQRAGADPDSILRPP